MIDTLLISITLLSMFMVIYHHAIYPVLLGLLKKRLKAETVAFTPRHYAAIDDSDLPGICIVIPAYNEAEWVADKIHNLAFLDYPSNRLQVILACDGCTDNTAEIARECMQLPECADLNLEVREFRSNRGKVAVLNHVLHDIDAALVALSDVSALISVDALLIATAHFQDPKVGVLNSHYRILSPGSEGEESYWKYQSQIKSSEAALGATLGAHGAFYMFRRELFETLDADIINDDFVLPMQIVAKGYRAEHDNRILALELEQADQEMDRHRRLRISAGNLQQLLRLKQLLLPRYRGVAFAFASGKALRVAMPFLMIASWAGSIGLSGSHWFFLVAAVGQTLLYGLAAWAISRKSEPKQRMIKTLSYIVSGHLAGLLGSLQYIFTQQRGPWRRVTEQPADTSQDLEP